MTVLDEKLEPCPFCGRDVNLVESKNAPDRLLIIACTSPSPCIGSGLGGFYILESQRADGIAAWNRRHPSQELVVAQDALTKIAERIETSIGAGTISLGPYQTESRTDFAHSMIVSCRDTARAALAKRANP